MAQSLPFSFPPSPAPAELQTPSSPASRSPSFSLTELPAPIQLSELPVPGADPGSAEQEGPSEPAELSESCEPKRKRGRKKRYVTEEQRREKEEKRVERNRYFARENRRRKKEYVTQLERRIESLSAELSACKQKLATYEALEMSRQKGLVEFCRKIKDDAQQFDEQRLARLIDLTYRSDKPLSELVDSLKTKVEDKKKAVDVLAEALIDFSVPFAHRYVLCMAEQNDTINTLQQALEQRLEEAKVGPMDCRMVIDQIRNDRRRMKDRMPAEQRYLLEIAAGLRRSVKRYLQSVANIREHMANLDLYLTDRIDPNLDPNRVVSLLKWMHMAADARTLNQLMLFGEGFTNFSLAVAKWPFVDPRLGDKDERDKNFVAHS